MADQYEELFQNLRRGPWHGDINAIPQEGAVGNGNIESQGWLSDGSVSADVIQANAITADKIQANAITAGKIAAGSIETTHLAAEAVTAAKIEAGTITANEIAADTITANEIATNTITSAEIAANAINASEINADAVTTTKILAGNVTSSRIEVTVSGKTFGANDGDATLPGLYFDSLSTRGLYLVSGAGGLLVLQRGSTAALGMGNGFSFSNVDFNPLVDNTAALGQSGARWTEVWAVDGSINTSDARMKMDIQDSRLGLGFIRSLKPRSYRWRSVVDTQAREAAPRGDGQEQTEELGRRIREIRAAQLAGEVTDADGNAEIEAIRAEQHAIEEAVTRPQREAREKRRAGRREHYGLIAQEVKEALDAAGVDAAFWRSPPDGAQGLIYTELIAPLIKAVQELADRLDSVESNLAPVEN